MRTYKLDLFLENLSTNLCSNHFCYSALKQKEFCLHVFFSVITCSAWHHSSTTKIHTFANWLGKAQSQNRISQRTGNTKLPKVQRLCEWLVITIKNSKL